MTIKKIEPKVLARSGVVPSEVQVDVKSRKADEDRIEALEKKLNQLLEEVASLKKSKGD